MTQVAKLNFHYDYSPVILWQYDAATKLKKIISNEQSFLDTAVTLFREEFDRDIFNLDTCNADGLELWGKLLQVNRPIVDGEFFSDEQYRLLLKSRIYVLVWDGSSYGLTKIIKGLFPDALFYVEDGLDMTTTISFAAGITPEQEAVLRMGYIDPKTSEFVYTFLPRPAGVEYKIAFSDAWTTTLGFEGMTEIIDVGGTPTLKEGSTTNMGGTYNNDPDDHEGTTGTENTDGGVFYK